MKVVRQIFFWLHLVAGLVAGLVIAVLCFTGAALAYEKELIAWADRANARVSVANDATRLTLDELQQRFRAAQPEARAASIIVQNDPAAAVLFSVGREGGFYVDPFTGEVRAQGATGTRAFMRTMNAWHRTLDRDGEQSRAVGKAVTGVANLAFAFLACSGLYLWWPRNWSWRGVKAVAVLNLRLAGKARDFNWHNALGLWAAPVLIVLTLTALPISYRWAGNLIFTLVGETPPAPGAGPGAAGPAAEVPAPAAGAKRLGQDALLAVAQQAVPEWQQLTLRLGGAGGRGERSPRSEGSVNRAPAATEARGESAHFSRMNAGPGAETRGETPLPAAADGERRGPQAVAITIRAAGSWPRTATTTLSLDPFTGAVLKREGFSDQSTARQIRSWTRFLHTGEALGGGGQFVAGLACLTGLVLCYTGFALSCRRFFRRSDRSTAPVKPSSPAPS